MLITIEKKRKILAGDGATQEEEEDSSDFRNFSHKKLFKKEKKRAKEKKREKVENYEYIERDRVRQSKYATEIQRQKEKYRN